MLTALSNRTDHAEYWAYRDVVRWCGKFTPAPERVVPLLLDGLELDEAIAQTC